jgi:hypothetical protein
MQLPLISTGTPTLRRALVASAVLHVVLVGGGSWRSCTHETHEVEVVDIEVAPEAPKAEALPEETVRAREKALAEAHDDEAASAPANGESTVEDAGVPDAAPDAAVDAALDAALDAEIDAEVPMVAATDDAGDATDDARAASDDAGTTVASVLGPPSSDTLVDGGVGPTIADSFAAGSAAVTEPAVEGAPTTAGTAANLLAYFPAGHVVTVMLRLDRVRGTEWAAQAEKLIKPLPDYRALFGDGDVKLVDKFETLVISTPSPRDAAVTTLVARTTMARPALRAFLESPASPVVWSAGKGGLVGRRTHPAFPNDTRVFLSPFAGWFLLVQPSDVTGLLTIARGNLDRVEATAPLPAWLQSVRSIEKESGDPRGPAVVVTLGFHPIRQKIPDGIDIAIGVKEVPLPDRVSVAMELVPKGWLVRGNLHFASDADAREFTTAVATIQQRVHDSSLLAGPLRAQHVLNAVTGLSLQQTGPRVSYATSLSIADARALFGFAATTLADHFAKP